MTQPLVSVCLITYRHEDYIRQALESIMMQKVNFSWEVIVADDCSPDNTRQIISEYKDKYPDLVKLLFQEKNVGGGINFVDLLNSAKGKYIAYLEGDDYWIDEDKLQKQYDCMEKNPGFSMCYHQSNRVYTQLTEWALKNPQEAPDYISNQDDPPVSDIFDILHKGWFIFSNTMFFRNIKLPVGFENLYVGDYPLHVLLADYGKIGFISESMGVYRINHYGQSTTRLHTNNFWERENNFKAEIHLLRYLNAKTNFKYNNIFKKKIFDLIYSHSHFTFKTKINQLWPTFKYCMKEFGVIFIINQVANKILRKGFKSYKK